MNTRKDITPADLEHIRQLAAELCADLPQRCARYRRRVAIFRLTLSLGLVVFLPLMVNATGSPTSHLLVAKANTLTTPVLVDHINYMLAA